MRAGILALVAFLRARHRPAARDAAVEELPGRRRALRRPRQLRPLLRDADAGRLAVEQLLGGGAVDGDRGAAGVPLRLRAHAHAACRPSGLFMALALLPLFAPSLLSAISLIYIFGNQGFLKSWLMGASVYGPIGIVLAQVFYCFPHALMILVTALSLADGRLYEAAAAHGHAALARVLDRDPAGRALRPDLGRVRRLHAGHHRFRHRQGDRRAVQRAGDRCLQAGHRPAELRDGRGGRLRAAGAGGDRLRARPA